MDRSHLLNVREQLVGYGAYHAHPTNIAVHLLFVPVLVWTAQALGAYPVLLPSLSHTFNDWMRFDVTPLAVATLLSVTYYFLLEPFAALIYVPQIVLMLLTATSFAHRPKGVLIAVGVHIVSWLAQFAGHKFAEKRAPALLDNLLGAFVLAPFFVHLENLFALGYNKELHKEVMQGVNVKRAEFEAKKKPYTNGVHKKDL